MTEKDTMANAAKMPENWQQMDPDEQYRAALERARREVDAENRAWRDRMEKEAAAEAFAAAKEKWDRAELVLQRIGMGLLILLVAGAAGFFIWLSMVNQTDLARDRESRNEWIAKCVAVGGGVYQQAGSGSGAGPLLCIVGGKAVQP